ncbi:DUF7661 family protein [Algicola sagamiensis]|uniref:DUF7661 family protein n=1 Tax=Algicola sagamiensis TaxID=163869 RepID=UPI00058AE49A|nr:hypothetical protein [Algicola sagamiensis]
MKQLHFNVFGQRMSVQRHDHEWLLFHNSDKGLKSREYSVIIPSELSESEIALFLADIYHEHASEQHPDVIQLN